MAKRLGRYLAEQMILKITLLGSEPKIWRRVEVHSGLTLHELHYVIQCVFDWDDSHLYQFLVPPGGKLTQKAMREATRFLIPPDPGYADEFQTDRRADEELIGRVFTDDCKQIVYEYDFGDSWEHLVKLEKRTPGGDQDHVPVCLSGENAAPPDDVGGIDGYYQWLEALQNSEHEMNEEAVEWFGENFDPARFDPAEANKCLAVACRPAPKKPRRRRK